MQYLMQCRRPFAKAAKQEVFGGKQQRRFRRGTRTSHTSVIGRAHLMKVGAAIWVNGVDHSALAWINSVR